jgi:hypothetical protein
MTPTILEIVIAFGCALILVGILLIYLPAALITAGIMLLLLALLTYAWDGTNEENP